MIIAIASGKGGTGKTLVSVNLARSVSSPVLLLDCDVEEPNDHVFLHGRNTVAEETTIKVPVVDGSLCNGCGVCSSVCTFNAIAVIARQPLVFGELCHACGACMLFCPRKAISEQDHRIGAVETFVDGNITLVQGQLDVGVSLAVPLIRAVKRKIPREAVDALVIVDSPPGTSCPMVWTVSGCDAVVLVAEGTPFGLHDLQLAVAAVGEIGVPFGVVLNKVGVGG